MDCCGHTNDLVPHSFALGMPLASVGAILAGKVGPVGSNPFLEPRARHGVDPRLSTRRGRSRNPSMPSSS